MGDILFSKKKIFHAFSLRFCISFVPCRSVPLTREYLSLLLLQFGPRKEVFHPMKQLILSILRTCWQHLDRELFYPSEKVS